MKRFCSVRLTMDVFVPERIAKGDRDALVDYLNMKLYNHPEFFDGFVRDDVRVDSKIVKGEYAV